MLLVVFFFFFSVQCVPINIEKSPPVPLLLLISFDGFRWDYPDLYHLPHFDQLAKRGVRLENIENSFATVTFPSHFTMITGLFEETHGIVANTIYDPTFNESVTIVGMNDTKWWSQNPWTQPIWITNQLATNSSSRRSGVISWPGCNIAINGHLPTKFQPFEPNRSFDSIVKQMFDWFHENESTRINFGVMYFPEPDETGHLHGPHSPEMAKTLAMVDSYVGQLLQMIDRDEYLRKYLNVIITSDHGMHEIDGKHQIVLEKLIDKSLYNAFGKRAFANIFVKRASDIERIYANLSTLTNYEVYKKSDIPDEYHYQFNVRIGDILIISRIGYEILLPGDDGSERRYGDHGYDNRAESMHPIFYAFGPAFRQINRAKAFRNVDLFPLMSYLLDIPIRLTNGSLENVYQEMNDS